MILDNEIDFEQARENMIEQQIRPWDVLDPRVLELLRTTPRELFVPEGYRRLAFADLELPLPHGERMLCPKLEGRMLQALEPAADDRALEIGTGSGYVTACLARAAAAVDSIELYADLSEAAQAKLEQLQMPRVQLVVADALQDWQPHGHYDVIAITGSLPGLADLQPFENALAEGGRLFAVVGLAPTMEATLVVRHGPVAFSRLKLFETVIPPLIGATPPERFVF
mgnify:CR=1 FL=1